VRYSVVSDHKGFWNHVIFPSSLDILSVMRCKAFSFLKSVSVDLILSWHHISTSAVTGAGIYHLSFPKDSKWIKLLGMLSLFYLFLTMTCCISLGVVPCGTRLDYFIILCGVE